LSNSARPVNFGGGVLNAVALRIAQQGQAEAGPGANGQSPAGARQFRSHFG